MIEQYKVYGLEDVLRQSGLPMVVAPEELEEDLSRAKRLGRAKIGSGHDCFLKGIMVNLEIKATLKWFDQFDRYSFQDTISSTSQMHRITAYDLDNQFHDLVDNTTKEHIKWLVEHYNDNPSAINFERLIYNVPQGFLYTRAITTNYLQLKTMYYQRKNHKLTEWKEFCSELEELPKFMELIGERA